MAPRFPLFIDLYDNNCTIFGGGSQAAARAAVLLKFGAKVTVISPSLCKELKEMDEHSLIRYIPRRYYRGDCSSSYICIAATNNETVNISISDECKSKAIAVNVTRPAAFGTFQFPAVAFENDISVAVVSNTDDSLAKRIQENIQHKLTAIVEEVKQEKTLK